MLQPVWCWWNCGEVKEKRRFSIYTNCPVSKASGAGTKIECVYHASCMMWPCFTVVNLDAINQPHPENWWSTSQWAQIQSKTWPCQSRSQAYLPLLFFRSFWQKTGVGDFTGQKTHHCINMWKCIILWSLSLESSIIRQSQEVIEEWGQTRERCI